MKITKNLITALTLFTVISVPFFASAQVTTIDIGSRDKLIATIGRVADGLRAIFFALAAIFFIIAAYRYLTAQGDETKVAGAKTMIIYTVIALVIALVAGSIDELVGNILRGQ